MNYEYEYEQGNFVTILPTDDLLSIPTMLFFFM